MEYFILDLYPLTDPHNTIRTDKNIWQIIKSK